MKYVLLVSALLLASGCNLFGPFHDEGNSEDLDDIIGDVEAALERGEPDKAYEYAVDGIEKYPNSVSLHYLGAVAAVQDGEIGFADFASMVRSGDDDGEPYAALFRRGAVAEGETTFFFEDLLPEDLAAMAGAFNTSYDLLEAAVQLIEDGHATAEDLADFESDIELGLGVSGLLKAILTVLDSDNDLDNGFDLNPSIDVYEAEDGWSFTAAVVPDVVCAAMPSLRVAEEALYDHYRGIADDGFAEDIPPANLNVHTDSDSWVGPDIDDGMLSGEIFASVHNGIVDFFEHYSCD
jgi:hypothetical protein